MSARIAAFLDHVRENCSVVRDHRHGEELEDLPSDLQIPPQDAKRTRDKNRMEQINPSPRRASLDKLGNVIRRNSDSKQECPSMVFLDFGLDGALPVLLVKRDEKQDPRDDVYDTYFHYFFDL